MLLWQGHANVTGQASCGASWTLCYVGVQYDFRG